MSIIDKKHKSSSKKPKVIVEEYINDEDYYCKHQEFILWLRENKGLFIEQIDNTTQLKQLFHELVKQWNKGKLSHEYYSGISNEPSSRTSYRWQFADSLDAVVQGNVNDEVRRITDSDLTIRSIPKDNNKLQVEIHLKKMDDSNNDVNDSNKRKHQQKDVTADNNSGEKEKINDEERRIADYAARKKLDRKFAKHKDVIMEELVPKATGRDALLEKKKQLNQYHRKSNDDDAQGDLENYDAFGATGDSANDSIHSLIQRDKDKRERIAEAKRESYEKKLAEYKAKEQSKLEQFRSFLQPH